jgi:hypothetical protein
VDVEVSGGINLLVGLCKKKLKVKKGWGQKNIGEKGVESLSETIYDRRRERKVRVQEPNDCKKLWTFLFVRKKLEGIKWKDQK